MNFNIYSLSDGRLNKLYRVSRIDSGLYFHPFGNWPHFSYHTSGETHYKHPSLRGSPEFNTKKQRTPLYEFVGPESITSFNVMGFKAIDTKKHQAKPKDIVINIKPSFCVEIILTSKEIELPESPERKNSQLFFKKDISPMIIVEAFNLDDRRLVEQRYRITHPSIV
jgi:hypothetical protein